MNLFSYLFVFVTLLIEVKDVVSVLSECNLQIDGKSYSNNEIVYLDNNPFNLNYTINRNVNSLAFDFVVTCNYNLSRQESSRKEYMNRGKIEWRNCLFDTIILSVPNVNIYYEYISFKPDFTLFSQRLKQHNLFVNVFARIDGDRQSCVKNITIMHSNSNSEEKSVIFKAFDDLIHNISTMSPSSKMIFGILCFSVCLFIVLIMIVLIKGVKYKKTYVAITDTLRRLRKQKAIFKKLSIDDNQDKTSNGGSGGGHDRTELKRTSETNISTIDRNQLKNIRKKPNRPDQYKRKPLPSNNKPLERTESIKSENKTSSKPNKKPKTVDSHLTPNIIYDLEQVESPNT